MARQQCALMYAWQCRSMFEHAPLMHAALSVVRHAAGVSNLVSDRDFVVRAARVCFPNGMSVLTCQSVGPGEAVPGDPGPMPRMIRWAGFKEMQLTTTQCREEAAPKDAWQHSPTVQCVPA